ncbi:MAG: LysM peptidoglycan-binding domain-containing protein [Bacteroidales bacterium]|nr:LysM peptidoglycan-binding domain-containing protein [Bacteroidales bacterium]
MRTRLSTITGIFALSAVLMLAGAFELSAQEYTNTPVTISKEKVKVGGKVCYSHIVLEKQTLYSISKAYNVSIEDIYRFNPTLQEVGLKKNSIILIPSAEALKEEVKVTEDVPVEKEQKVVEKKDGKKKKIHTRKWYEDLDMIAAQYGVTVEDIMEANNLTDKKLSSRQKLIIPQVDKSGSHSGEESATSDAAESLENATEVNEDAGIQARVDESQFEWVELPTMPIKATVLLPMRNAEGKLSRNNMDFYSGFMLAVHNLSQKGVNIDVSTFDLSDQEHPANKEDIENSDIIIGPISAADQTRLFQTSGNLNAVISPLDPRSEKLATEYNKLIQAPTSHKTQYEDLTSWIKEELGDNDKVIVFSERTARENKAASLMKEVIDSSGIAYTPFTYSILEGRDILEPLKEIMTPEGANRIYIASESEAFVNDVVRNLNLMLLENFEVILYAPSKIRSFDTIEVEHFHKTSMRVSLNYYINYETQEVKDFLLKYRALYNTEPSQFAFQGYDVGYYFLNLCHRYGQDWATYLENSDKTMLQSTFDFTKLGTGGHINTGVRRIVYGPKWTITQIK